MSLNTERTERGIVCTTLDGREVGVISYTRHGQWLVTATEEFNHGSATMWWKTLQAAEYHMLALAAEKGE